MKREDFLKNIHKLDQGLRKMSNFFEVDMGTES